MSRPGYQAPLWLRNAHVQSVLSSLPLRRSAAQRVLERTGAVTKGQLVAAGDGVTLQASTTPSPAARRARSCCCCTAGKAAASRRTCA